MAKKSRNVPKIDADTIPTTVQLSDIEKADAALISATAAPEPTEGGKDGDGKQKRLPYQPFSPEAFRGPLRHPAARRVPNHLWYAYAAAKGASLSPDDVAKVAGHDPDMPSRVNCTGIVEGGKTCGFEFEPTRTAWINSETGEIGTDERFVTEANPEGIGYEGAFLAIPVEPGNRHSKSKELGPLCPRCMGETRAFFAKTGRGLKLRSRSKEQIGLLITAINTGRDAGRQAYEERQAARADAFGVQPRSRGFNGPRTAQAGRQGRDRDPRERNIGNRG